MSEIIEYDYDPAALGPAARDFDDGHDPHQWLETPRDYTNAPPRFKLIGIHVMTVKRRTKAGKRRDFYLRWTTNEGDNGAPKSTLKRLFSAPVNTQRGELLKLRRRAAAECEAMRLKLTSEEREPSIMFICLKDAIEHYRIWAAGLGNNLKPPVPPEIFERRSRVLIDFLNFMGDTFSHIRKPSSLTNYHTATFLDRYRDANNYGPGTMLQVINHLCAWIKFCIRLGFIRPGELNQSHQRSLYRAMLKKRNLADGADIPTPQQVRAALAQADGLTREIVHVLAVTGMRSGELQSLHPDDFNPRERFLHIPASEAEENGGHTKHHQRTIPIPPKAADILAARPRSNYLFTETGRPLGTKVNKLLDTVGLKPHQLRRYVCQQLENWEAPERTITDLLGHMRGPVRRAYSNGVAPDTMRHWVEKLESLLISADNDAGHPL